MTTKILYRYGVRDYGDYIQLHCSEHKIYKITPKGWWISKSSWDTPDSYWFEENVKHEGIKKWCRWVSKTGKKRYAYPTKELAFESFLARKQRFIAILEYQLKIAKLSIQLKPDHVVIKKNSISIANIKFL